MAWVVDSSVTMAWCFEDEQTPQSEELLDRLAVEPAIVPQIWTLEVSNVLLLATRRGRISAAKRSQFIAELALLPIQVDLHTSAQAFSATLMLAEAHQLTSYDAAYLELALRLGVPLATTDQALRRAASAAGAPLL